MSENHKNPLFKLLKLSLDLLVIVVLFYTFLFIHIPTVPKNLDGLWILTHSQYKSLGLFILSWLLISQQTKIYGVSEFYLESIRKVFYQLFLFSLVVFAVSGIKTDYLYTNNESAFFIGVVSVYLMGSRMLSWLIEKSRIKTNNKSKSKVIFIGKNNNTHAFKKLLTDKKNQYEIVSHMVEVPEGVLESKFNMEELEQNIKTYGVDCIYISMFSKLPKEIVHEIINLAEKSYVKFEFIQQNYLEQYETYQVKYYDTFPIFTIGQYPLDGIWNQVYKRVFDIVFSVFIIVFVLSWLYPIIALLIVLDSGFPVIYRQKRNGFQGEFFNCLKFRSMRPSKDNDRKATVKGDLRITRIGRFLRKSSIDELPQFFNVLKGDMSVVGPRPHMISQDDYYTKIIKKYTLRHHVKPGITGLAQIRGYRGEVNSDHDMGLRIRADVFYVRNWSFWMDIIIIVKTAWKMIIGDENAI